MTTFRVHTRTAGNIDVEADDPNHARKIVQAQHPKVIISKIKIVKEGNQ